MHGPGEDDRTPPEASDEPEVVESGEASEEVPEDAGEASVEPEAPKVAVGWGEGPRPKWERPVEVEEEKEPPPNVFDTSIRRSSRLHKDQVAAFAKLTKDIVELSESKRAKLELDPEVAAAFTACLTIKKGARVRELRRISTMLRRFDGAALRARVDDLKNKDRETSQRAKGYERWRERLLDEGDAALSEFVQAYPTADRQRLRQLVRTANRDRTQGKSRQAFRDLLREVRALAEAAE